MFRAIIKDRKNLDAPQIADIPVLSGSVSEDKAQKATSSFVVSDFPDNVKLGDVIGIYDGTGKFYYWGVITSKGEEQSEDQLKEVRTRTIECDQFESLYNDEQLILAHTSDNQKKMFKNSTVSESLDYYLKSREFGYMTMANTINSTKSPHFTGYLDPDVRDTFKGIRHEIIDDGKNPKNEDEHMICPKQTETVNLEDLLYGTFNKYRRMIRPFFNRPILPDEYQSVLYIESDGTDQYINTGVSPGSYSNNLRLELDAEFTVVTDSNRYLLSSAKYNSDSSNRRNIIIGTSPTKFRMLNGANISNASEVGDVDTNRHVFIIDQVKSCYTLFNNTNFTSTTGASLVKPIILFAYYTSASSGEPISIYSPGRIYSFRAYNGGAIIRNMVPCYRKSDMEVGMYDTVNGVFYENANENGTGVFTKSSKIYDNNINLAIFNAKGIVTYNFQHTWDFSEKIIFDTMETVKNVSITDEEVDTNTVMVYNDDGTTLRGAFTVLQDGTVQQTTSGTSYPTRYGTGKTAYVFDATNEIKDIAKNNFPASQFDHKIEFTIMFNGEYSFSDFNLGQKIKFYSKTRPGKVYETCITAWSYEINQNSDRIYSATFTLGNVRNNLTSKINLKKKK